MDSFLRLRQLFSRQAILALLILSVFASVSLFGPVFLMNAGMGHEIGCPFEQDSTSLCPMTLLDHLGVWQESFAAVLMSFLLFLVLPVFSFPRSIRALNQRKVGVLPNVSIRTYSIFSQLFASGILNTKRYA